MPRSPHLAGRRAGFTLLEVLVAMAILATSLVVLLENHGSSIRISQRARLMSLAANLARDLLTEVEIGGFPEPGTEAGDFNERYPGMYMGFAWEREISDSVFADYIREVVVRVTFVEDGIPHSVELIDLIAAKTLEEQDASGAGGSSGEPSAAESAMMSSMGRTSGDDEGGSEAKP